MGSTGSELARPIYSDQVLKWEASHPPIRNPPEADPPPATEPPETPGNDTDVEDDEVLP
jgi:hypothetical protein